MSPITATATAEATPAAESYLFATNNYPAYFLDTPSPRTIDFIYPRESLTHPQYFQELMHPTDLAHYTRRLWICLKNRHIFMLCYGLEFFETIFFTIDPIPIG